MGLYRRKDSPVYWMSFTKDGRSYNRSTGTEDKAIAQKIYDILKGKIAIGQWHPETVKVEKREYTFRELTAKYLEWLKGRQKSEDRKRRFIKQLVEKFGDMELNMFSVEMLEQWQSARIAKGNEPSTANRLLATLKHMFTKAADWNMVSDQASKCVRKVKLLEENNKRLRYLSLNECNELVSSCDTHLKPIVITALNTGMRRGEVLGLQWDKHIDLKHGFILLDKTKNGERREIPINKTLRETLTGLTRRLDVPYVFYDPTTGKPYAEVRRSFNTALRLSKIHDFKFHDLRHTFASHLVMAGIDITTVKELLGHKTISMTLRYAHLAPSHKVKAIAVFDQILTGKLPKKQDDYYDFTTLETQAANPVAVSH